MLFFYSVLLPFLPLVFSRWLGLNICGHIRDGNDFGSWKNCKMSNDYTRNLFGDRHKFVRLNFSNATEKEFTEFFKKSTEPATLSGGIIISKNNKIKKLDFGNLTNFTLKAEVIQQALDKYQQQVPLLIIEQNWQLTEIKIDLKSIEAGNNVLIQIANNPKLKIDEKLMEILMEKANSESYIWTDDCRYNLIQKELEIMAQEGQDYLPSAEELAACQNITGDLYLENMTLTNSKTIGGGCLRLINVDFKTFRIKPAESANGTWTCRSGNTSEIVNNPNLCGKDLEKLVDYIEKDKNFTEKIFRPILHVDTCSKVNCTSEDISDRYYLCPIVNIDVTLSEWFMDPDQFQQKINTFQSATGKIIISRVNSPEIWLPSLENVKHLIITENEKLEIVSLPALKQVEILTITGNPLWRADGISKTFWKISTMKLPKSRVECYLADGEEVENFDKIRLCTHFYGNLTLTTVEDKDAALFQARELHGCLTVKNTQLTSLFFLKEMNIIECKGNHTIAENPYLCARGFLIGTPNVTRENNFQGDCPCILDNLLKTSIKTSLSPSNCAVTHVYKEFDCNLYTADHLVEVRGTLILKNCANLDETFPKLKKIDSEQAPVLVVKNSSGLPSVGFLERISMNIQQGSKISVEIQRNMSIDEYLMLKYSSMGKNISLPVPDSPADICYNLEDIRGCKIFSGDLVVRNDELNETTSIETITGCLIVQHGSQLNFLNELKNVGKSCLYGDKDKYPLSPSRELLTTEIDKMNPEYCPTREERERLAEVLGKTPMELSGKANSCAKSCIRMSAGNCETFHGDLVLQPSDPVENLEAIFGSLFINGTLKETLNFPKLTRISAPTAPALKIHNNVELQSLRMPKLVNISAFDDGKPLIIITKNSKLKNLADFIPEARRPQCKNDPTAICYADIVEFDKMGQLGDRNLEDAKILGIFLFVAIGIPAAYFCLCYKKRQKWLEEKKRRRESARKKRKIFVTTVHPSKTPKKTSAEPEKDRKILETKENPEENRPKTPSTTKTPESKTGTPGITTSTKTTESKTPASTTPKGQKNTPSKSTTGTPTTTKTPGIKTPAMRNGSKAMTSKNRPKTRRNSKRSSTSNNSLGRG